MRKISLLDELNDGAYYKKQALALITILELTLHRIVLY